MKPTRVAEGQVRPIALFDCNLEAQSGRTFHEAIARCAPAGSEFLRFRIPEQEEFGWLAALGPEEISKIVISGSAAGVEDGPAWLEPFAQALKTLTAKAIPTLGICFGHQVLAYAWGAKVKDNILGYKVRGVEEIATDDRADAAPALSPGTLRALVSHRDQVVEAPPGWQVVARSPYCPIQALRAPDLPILTVQWHPEGDGQFIRDNPHPDWDHLAQEELTSLSGVQILRDFLHQKG